MTKPILTVTLNPALDMTVSLNYLSPGEVNKANASQIRAAGKGLNVAKVLHDLASPVMVSGFLGEDNFGLFKEFCHHHSIDNQFLYLPGATRINVKISEQGGRVTDINLPGLPVPDSQWQAFKQRLQHLAQQSSAVVLAGSLPPGLAETAYAELIADLQAFDVPIVLDSSGKAFAEAVKAKPYMVKPNIEELQEWSGQKITSTEELKNAAEVLLGLGIQHVVISDGANGCYWFCENEAMKAIPPKVNVVSTVGAGDSLVAALTYGLVAHQDKSETLKQACAISAHAVEQVGVGIVHSERYEFLKALVHLEEFQTGEAL